LLRESRLGGDPGVVKIEVENMEGHETLTAIKKWLDEVGI
jgi:hypothetical protein